MKTYTNSSPEFSDEIEVVEVTDPAHADNINMAPKQLLQNDLVLAMYFADELMDEAFNAVFEDTDAMTPGDVNSAIQEEWDGTGSADSTAMTPGDVNSAVQEEWDGTGSADSTAMTPDDVNSATVNR